MRKFLGAALSLMLPAAVLIGSVQVAAAATPSGQSKASIDLKAGKKIYETNCATCHGTIAAGKPTLPNAANFFTGKLRLTHGNPVLMAKIITIGGRRFGHGASFEMPAWGTLLSHQQVLDVTAFERTLHKK